MNELFVILSLFRPLFNTQNYVLFSAFILGIMFYPGRKTVTGICQITQPSKYWSLIKFLSRAKWNQDAVALLLLRILQSVFNKWVYVYDETHTTKTGKHQFGLHFFRNNRYQKKNTNQSKFHWGHQFAALGLLCMNLSQAILFPVWVKMIIPADKLLNSLTVLETIMSKIPAGLVILDRGFNKRKVFKILLSYGHHLLCRAKSNAVFYYLPNPEERHKRGRPKKYGDRVDINRMHFHSTIVDGQTAEVSDAIVCTKMCPQKVRLVVRRTLSEKTSTYKYFMVYTTDLSLSVETVLHYYRLRWEQETSFRDAKQNFGFDEYQVKSEKSISRFVSLSFVSMSIMQLLYIQSMANVNVDEVCETLGIHWYRPAKLTRGLMQSYLRYLAFRFSSSKAMLFKTHKNVKALAHQV
jgi:hypothetical protein